MTQTVTNGAPPEAPGQAERGGQPDAWLVKKGLAQMLKGGVIMDVVTAEQARIAEEAGAVAWSACRRTSAPPAASPG